MTEHFASQDPGGNDLSSPFNQPNSDGSLHAFVKALEAEAAESEFEDLIDLVETDGLKRGEFTAAVMQMLTLIEYSNGDDCELMELVMSYQSYDLPALLRVTLDILHQMTCKFAELTGITSAELLQRLAMTNAAYWTVEGGEHAEEG